jgi:hypothetical protein
VKLINYLCDVCRDIIRKGYPYEDIRPFVSYKSNIMANHAPAKDRFAIVDEPFDAEHHVCHLCLAGLLAMANEFLPVVAKATGGQCQAPTVAERSAPAGMFCCLCGGSLAGHSASILPVGSLGNAHASCVETARAAAAGADEARAYAARTAEARVHAVRESSP